MNSGMETMIAGVTLKNPVTTASGTFGSGREYGELIDLNRLGAITVKGVSEEAWKGNPVPRVAETQDGLLNSIGLQNAGAKHFIENDIPFLRQYDTKIIVNICGHTLAQYCSVAEKFADCDIDLLELNISCPNVEEGGLSFGTDTGNYKTMISYVDPDKLTGFYERRQQVLDEFLEVSGQVGAEKEFLHQIERKVEKPFRYEWVEGWSTLLGSMVADLGVVMALFLGIVLSSLFAGEWHDNTSTLVLTTRNGWGKIALAKILTGLAFTVELFALLAVSNVISQLFFMGTAGWDMPIQNIKLIAVAPMNMLQAEIYEYAFVLLGAIGFAGIVMFISAAVKNNVLTLLLSLAVVYGPMMIVEYLPYEMQKALDLIPLVGSSTDIFRTNTFRIFGKLIWSPYLLITIPVLIGILCMPFAIKSWSRRMKA